MIALRVKGGKGAGYLQETQVLLPPRQSRTWFRPRESLGEVPEMQRAQLCAGVPEELQGMREMLLSLPPYRSRENRSPDGWRHVRGDA